MSSLNTLLKNFSTTFSRNIYEKKIFLIKEKFMPKRHQQNRRINHWPCIQYFRFSSIKKSYEKFSQEKNFFLLWRCRSSQQLLQ
jgi:hypothetical protein